MEITVDVHLRQQGSSDEDIPDWTTFLSIMGTKRLEPIPHRVQFRALYDAFLPHADLILAPLDRQASIK